MLLHLFLCNRRASLLYIISGIITNCKIVNMSSSSSNNNSNKQHPYVDFDKTETVGSTRWMRLETLSYHVPPEDNNNNNNSNTLCKWDRAVRTTKQSEDSIDAVVILAILKNNLNNPNQDEIVCVTNCQ